MSSFDNSPDKGQFALLLSRCGFATPRKWRSIHISTISNLKHLPVTKPHVSRQSDGYPRTMWWLWRPTCVSSVLDTTKRAELDRRKSHILKQTAGKHLTLENTRNDCAAYNHCGAPLWSKWIQMDSLNLHGLNPSKVSGLSIQKFILALIWCLWTCVTQTKHVPRKPVWKPMQSLDKELSKR